MAGDGLRRKLGGEWGPRTFAFADAALFQFDNDGFDLCPRTDFVAVVRSSGVPSCFYGAFVLVLIGASPVSLIVHPQTDNQALAGAVI